MLNQRGQFSTDVGNVIALIMLIAIGAFVTYSVTGAFSEDIQQNTHTTDQREFVSSDAWTLDAGGSNLTIAHNATGDYIDIGATGSADNIATIKQTLEVDDFEEVDTASMEVAYNVDNADNLQSENMELYLIDPNGTVVANTSLLSDVSTTQTYSSDTTDLTDVIDEEGTWTIKVHTEVATDGAGFNSQVDNVELNVETTTYAGSAISNVEEKGGTSFNLMTILVIVIIAAVIIGVVLRALAGRGNRTGGPAPAY